MSKYKQAKCSRILFFIMLLSIFCFAVSSFRTKIYAENTANVQMTGGAFLYVGTENKNGIRFELKISDENYNAIIAKVENGELANVEFGIAIAPRDYDETCQINAASMFGEGGEKKYDWANLKNGEWVYEGDGTYTRIINLYTNRLVADETNGGYHYYGRIYNIATENLDREYTGVGYVREIGKDGTETYSFATANDNYRSMAYLGQVAVESESFAEYKQTIQESYIDPVKNNDTTYSADIYAITEEGEVLLGTEKVSAKIDSVITAPEKTDYIFDESNAKNEIPKKVYANGKSSAKLYYGKIYDKTSEYDCVVKKGEGWTVPNVFSGETTVSAVLINGTEYTDSVIDTSEIASGDYYVLVKSDAGYYYKIKLAIADVLITNAEELNNLASLSDGSTQYVIITKDIIYNEDAFATEANAYIGSQGSSYKMAASDYAGTLDGRGHTIYGFKVSNNNRGGLFYSVSKTGTVKNINFVDANLSSNYQYTNLIAYDTYGTVENVYASVKTTERTINFGVITNYVRNTCKLKDIVVNLDYTGDESRAGAITYSVVGSVATENCYVLSNLSKVSCKYNSGAPGAANETETAGAERLTGVVRIATEEELIEKANSGEFTDSINGVIKNGELEVVVDVTSGKLYGATIAGETITGVKSGETDLGYNGTENKIAVNGEESGESKVLTIETDKWTYTVTALYANVVSNPTEFLGISQYAKGYIVLTEDIKFTSGEKYTMGEVITGSITLDGKGHTVEGLDLSSSSQNSLFNISQSRTTETVTIKDISFTGVNLKESSGSNRVNLISRYPMIAVKMENLFVQVSSMTGGMGVLFDMFADKKVELKNTAIIGTATSYVVRTANSTPKAHTAEGSYFIGKAVNAGTFGSGGSFEKVNVLSAEANLYELIDNSTTTDTSGETVTWEGAETLKTLIQAYRAKTTA